MSSYLELQQAAHVADLGAAAQLVFLLGAEVGIDESKVFFEAVAVAFFGAFGVQDAARLFNECLVIMFHFFLCGGRATVELAEDVRVADSTAANHEAGRCGGGDGALGILYAADVTIAHHGAGGEGVYGAGDGLPVCLAAV